MKDQSIDMEFSSIEFDGARYSQSETATKKFSTSTPKKSTVYHDVLVDSDSIDDVELPIEGISNTSTVLTSPSIDAKLDIDVIEQMQIHDRRIWDRK